MARDLFGEGDGKLTGDRSIFRCFSKQVGNPLGFQEVLEGGRGLWERGKTMDVI